MSENLDLVRSIVEAWERGDFTSAEWADGNIEFVLPDGPDPGSWTGIAAMGAAWGRRISTAEGFRIAAEEFRELDDERVLVLTPVGGRSKRTGLDLGRMSRKGATLFHIRDGKVTRLVPYFDRDRAFADLGLAEQAMPEESTRPDLAELARLQVEAVNRRDFDALLTYAVPNVVYDTSPSGFGTYQGIPAIREFIESYWETFDELSFELDEFVDFGNDVTLTVNIQHALPSGSDARLQAREAHVTEWRDGLVVRVTVYMDIDEARAAAERLAAERG